MKRNPNAKLTVEQVREIINSEERGKALAIRYGVTQTTISQIRNGRTWREVK